MPSRRVPRSSSPAAEDTFAIVYGVRLKRVIDETYGQGD